MSRGSKIVLNTGIQYVRMIAVALIGIFSVRIIFNNLGENDYGLYNVLAGIIGLLSYITSSFNQTSFRYLSYTLGEGSEEEVSLVFTKCIVLHLIIGLIIVIALEILGVLMMTYLLNIPSDRVNAAYFVFQFMVFQLLFTVCTTPFSALVMAHEKFNIIAIVSILDAILKLTAAYCLMAHGSIDRLVLYGILLMVISILNFLFFILYTRHFHKKESQLLFKGFYFKDLKELTSFASWTLMDTMSIVCSRQGYAIMFNVFSGVQTNAVFGISRQVEGQISTISSSVVDTIKPQIMKHEAAGERKKMLEISMTAGKIGFALMSLFAIPLMFYMPDVLKLWLDNVPDKTVIFTDLIILAALSNQITTGLVYANQAIGNIKLFSIVISICRVMALPISCILLAFGKDVTYAMIVFVFCELIGSLARVFVMQRIGGLDVGNFFKNVCVRMFVPVGMIILGCYIVCLSCNSLIQITIGLFITCIIYLLSSFIIGLNNNEKEVARRIMTEIKLKSNIFLK